MALPPKSFITTAIQEVGVKKIVTADPHAYNALKNDYKGIAPVEHISQVITRAATKGRLQLTTVDDPSKVYTYHDPSQQLETSDEVFEKSDGYGTASILKAAVTKGSYDMILTGAQAAAGSAQVGGMLAAMLDQPYASLVNSIERNWQMPWERWYHA